MKDAKQARDGERPFQPFVPLDMVPPEASLDRRRLPLRALLVSFLILGLIGVAALTATALRRRDAIPTTLASPASSVADAPASAASAPAPLPVVDARQAPAATSPASNTALPPVAERATGTIVFPRSAMGHRRFIDGRVNDLHGPKLELPCGPHEVRIGSHGTPHEVQVPCGGEVHVK